MSGEEGDQNGIIENKKQSTPDKYYLNIMQERSQVIGENHSIFSCSYNT